MSPRYAYSLHERAALGIFAADEDERRELLEVILSLALPVCHVTS